MTVFLDDAVREIPFHEDLPLSWGQRALWYLHRLAPESAAYVIASAARIEWSVDTAAFQSALQALVDRHPALRTVFVIGPEGEPLQRTLPEAEIQVELWDAAGWSETELAARLREEGRRPFDLEQAPLLRAHLFTRGATESVFLLVAHHIITDLWSITVLMQELGIFYAASLAKRPADLESPAADYADYLSWQEEMLAAEEERLTAFWRQELAGAPLVLELPGDHPRPPVSSSEGAALTSILPEGLEGRLRELARAQGTNLFTVLLAGFQACLQRWTGQEDLLVGSPTAGRPGRRFAGVLGYFVNPVVLRGRPTTGKPFRVHLEETRESSRRELAHQQIPFPLLAETLQPRREADRSPIFQVMFVFQKAPRRVGENLAPFHLGLSGSRARIDIGGLPLVPQEFDQGVAQLDLTLLLAEMEGGLGLRLEYRRDLFERSTLLRFASHLEILLAGIATAPECPLGDLPLLSEGERAQLLDEWNATAVPETVGAPIHHRVAVQAARTPERVAVDFLGEALSYAELWERVEGWAAALRSLGVGPGTVAGIYVERSLDMVVALLAVLEAGGAYVPLDPAWPRERLDFVLEDVRCPVLLTHERMRGDLAGFRGRIVEMDGGAPEASVAPHSAEPDPAESDPADLAYVIYTSGSTGRPKGVAIPHGSAAAFVSWALAEFSPEELRVTLAATSICFDLSVFELFVPLSCGGKVLLARDALHLPELPGAGEVTLLNTVPSALAELLRLGAVPGSVRTVNLAGEPLPRSLADEIHRLGSVERLRNLYGPSEDTTYSTWTEVPRTGPVLIGRPIARTRAYVVNPRLELAPVGVPGELFLGGAGLARGYLGRPELTAERFLPDPFSGVPGERLYRTGDLVRWRAEGELEFLGRLDHQVKLRGFRIELGEIEEALLRAPGVREAVAVVRGETDRFLAAYLSFAEGAVEPAELRRHLKERLPAYMIPAAFVVLEALPRTPAGKVDRKALPDVEAPSGALSTEPVEPRDALEEMLAEVWSEVLGVERPGIHDSFFDLGGHSLLATRVFSRLREVLGVDLPLSTLFTSPTVAGLAETVRAARRSVEGPPAIPPARSGELPLSFAQERLWLVDRIEGGAAYSMPAALRLRGPLDVAALAWSASEVVRRHEVLRTTFPEAGGRPVQRVAAAAPVPLPVVDLAGLPPEKRRSEALRLAAEQARRPFDLARGPLFRLELLRLEAEEHILLVGLHHIVADGWSLGLLTQELAAHAERARDGGPPPPDPVWQYADFALWQRRWLQGEVLERDLAYWRQQLAGMPEALDLPADRPRPAVRSGQGAIHAFSLPASMVEPLRQLARSQRATQFMGVLAAFATLLHRLTGEEDFAVGAPVANRTWRPTESLLGLFVNTLVLRNRLDGGLAFPALVRRVRQVVVEAQDHQDLPFERLVEELRPERSLSRSPLFQVAVAWQSTALRPPRLPGVEAELLPVDSGTAKLDLLLDLLPGGSGIDAVINYNTDLFDIATIVRLEGWLRTLLAGIAAASESPLGDLPLLSERERAQLLKEWNATAVPEPVGAVIHRRAAAQAARTPERVAVDFLGEVLSYAELWERVEAWAAALRDLGVGPGTVAGIYVERSLDMVVGLLAVLEAGGAYVPLDPAWPRERLDFVLADVRCPVLLTHRRMRGDLAGFVGRIVEMDGGAPEAPVSPRSAEPDPSDLAYVIYTSGSTGRPKGVAIPHGSAAAFVSWALAEFSPEELRVTLAATSICFDLSVFELFAPLSCGGKVLLARDALHLPELPGAGEVTLLNTVPSALTELLRLGAVPGSVRAVNLAGEPLPRSLADEIHRLGSVERLRNLYGPSEDTTYSTWTEVPRTGPVLIGRPIARTRAYVVDPRLELAPVGVPGELLLGGAGLARGYLGRPELTAERFLPDPFSQTPGERLYRTGDLVRWRAEGELEFLGRLDHQVKLRGFRIELGEIEEALLRVPGVREAVVVVRGETDRFLVAYLSSAGGSADIAELRRHLKERLPAYMIPATFVVLEALPRTPAGKVDRKALPEVGTPSGTLSSGPVEPRDALEEMLAEIWSEVLGVERPGIYDSFFELGGHSLLATRVFSRLREVLGVDLPLSALFTAPTVAGLAETVRTARRSVEGPPPVPPARSGEPPLSFAQERLWLVDRIEGGAAYNMPAALRLRGPLDVAALAWSASEVVRRHEVLRTTFPEAGGHPTQRVAAAAPVPLPVVDLEGLPPEERQSEALRLAAEQAHRPFDLARGPLFRLELLRLEAEEHILLLGLHHIVADGWSLGLLTQELAAHAERARHGGPSPADPVWQYADFALWQRQWLQGEVLERDLAYWREQLAGMPEALDLPADRTRPAVRSGRGEIHAFSLSNAEAEPLRLLARSQSATQFMGVLAAFATLLHRLTGEEDFAIGAPVANRTWRPTESLLGLFVNTLVLRTRLDGGLAFPVLVRRVRQVVVEAQDHQDLPFERLVEELRPERSLSRSPLFQVALAWQSTALRPPRLPGVEAELLPVDSGTAKFDLLLDLLPGESGIEALFSYSTDLFDAATIVRLEGWFRTLLAGIAAAPESPLGDLPLLSERERAQLLEEWNATAVPEPVGAAIHRQVAAQVARSPERVAVDFLGEVLSYAELWERVEGWAAALRRLGVGPGTVVGIYVERSLDMVAGLLAVLEAGGAYVPLDPAWPRERRDFVLEDVRCPVLLTHRRMRDDLAGFAGRIVEVDGGAPQASVSPRSAEPDPAEPDPADLAYVIYTSGSTGRPKGVAIPHGSAAAFVSWALAEFSPEELRVTLAATSICFDLSVFELFVPLSCGGKVLLARDALHLAELPGAGEVTLLNTVPSALAELLRLGAVPGSVRAVNLAGEALPRSLADEIHRLGSVDRLRNLYGPSEDTTYSTWTEVPRTGPVLIGRPIARTRAYVVNPRLELAPVGVSGELLLGGAGLARGYLGRPELTTERFLPDPFSGAPGERLYRTGDLVRWRAEGELEFLGRLDHQVKLRGFRIELGEIEEALLRHPGVREAVVVVRGETDRFLAAYLAFAEGAVEAAELRRHLKERLPDYMIPAAFVVLEALPRTPAGKVDRKALPEIEREAGGGEAPRTPAEEMLAAIWTDLLGVGRVSRSDSFFDLGGHSLLATRVLSRVRELLRVDLPLRALFEAPTLEALARRIGEGVSARPSAPLVPVSRERELPLSFAQRRLWFLDRFEPGSPLYNIPAAVRLEGKVDEAALEAALSTLVQRHETLRTTFHEGAGEPIQRIAPAMDLPLRRLDLAEPEVWPFLAAEARRPFDLTTGPLMRVLLVRLAERDHVLFLNLHHMIADGWSLGVLVAELSALLAGRPLPELPVQYADFAVWQREHLAAVLEEQLAWWRETLAGVTPLELPADRPRPRVRGSQGATRSLRIAPELREGVERLARESGATPFMVLLAAFQALLGRWSRQTDIALGTPVASRERPELERLIGFFVNTLVLRTDLREAGSFTNLLAAARELTLDATARQDVPFDLVVEAVQPERDPSRTPLFQAMLAFQNVPLGPLELPGARLRPVDLDPGTAKVDLTLALADEDGGGWRGWLEHSTELFDGATIDRFAAHFLRLLDGAVERPGLAWEDLPLLSDQERHQLLVDWNETPREPAPAATVVELFTRRAAEAPERLAVLDGSRALTYGELAGESERLAAWLARQGVGPEDRVALIAPRSLELVIAMVGVARAGAAFLPLDPSHPPARLREIVRTSGARLTLDLATLRERPWQTEAGEAPTPDGEPERLAYVLYTSGSTGEPKGVMVSRAALLNLVRWHRRAHRLTAEDRCTLVASPAFDASVWEIWPALCAGASLRVVDEETRLAPERLLALWAEDGTTLAFLPTPLAEKVIEIAPPPGLLLRTLLTGGDRLRRVPTGLPYAVCNHYGPTEAAVVSTWALVERGSERPPAIGRPVDGTRAYVIDRRGEPVPVGVAGELCVAGASLARGYLDRPELTADAFRPDAFQGAGARLYRTGDLARWRADGELEFLGRIDHQFKLRGIRIEPAEIEAALLAHPRVAAAVVLPWEDARGRLLAAWVVPAEAIEADELRAFLAERLPEAMVPAAWVVLAELPLTSNGKIDRRALPAPRLESREGEAPRTPVEELVAGLWAELLGVPRLGRQDSFFEHGGHSLLATQVTGRVREVLGVEIPLRALFEAPTVEAFARRVEEARAPETPRPPLVAVPRGGDLPVSFAQRRLWFLDRLEPETALYNIPLAVRLEGDLDIASLQAALQGLAARHETLRTTFGEVAGEPVQQIAAIGDLPLRTVDLPPSEGFPFLEAEARRPFDLAAGPLVRALLVRLSEREHLLFLNLHHIIADGWSLGVLLRDLSALLTGRPLPALPIQHADYAVWERQHLAAVFETQLGWWRERLTGAIPLDLPADRPRPRTRSGRGATRPLRVSAALRTAVERLARERGATPFMVLLATFQALLGRWSGQTDVAVGTPVAHRHRPELERLIGFFVNTLVLRADLEDTETFAALLGAARELTLEASARQDVPFERIVEEVQPERDPSRTPLFQVMLAFQNLALPPLELPGVCACPVSLDSGTAKLDLLLSLADGEDGGWTGALEYSTDLFDGSTVERLGTSLLRLLEAAVVEPGTPWERLPLLTETERHEVLQAWNDTAADVPLATAPAVLFARQAALRPERTAVIDGLPESPGTVTYRELAARVDSLARWLAAAGVGPDSVVALLDDRGVDLLTAVLAVFAAGGAYLPLDPAHPPSRWREILRQSGTRLVLAGARHRPTLEEVLEETDRPIIRSIPESGDAGSLSAFEPGGGPESLAYVIYTSGSTGRPKGVMVPRRGMLNHVLAKIADLGLGPDDTVAQTASQAFDISVWQMLAGLLSGGRVRIYPDALSHDPPRLLEAVARERVTVLQLVPSVIRVMVEDLEEPGRTSPAPDLSALRWLFATGEALPPDLWSRWEALCPSVPLFNGYGPTEGADNVSHWPLGPAGPAPGRIPMGRPIANLRLYVLDRWSEPVPPGVAGELCIGGVGVARGYLGDPERTALAFRPDPAGGPGARLYRTGDLARHRPDGVLEYLGRVDHQVKIRGVRIEPAEVEAALARHPGVRAAVVMARADGRGGARLAAWVVGEEVDAEGLRAFLAGHLPDPMIPAAWVFLETLPLNRNGKVDRGALPEPAWERAPASQAPRTPLEEMVAGIWAEVLGVERPGVRESFFELGGHSLLATRVLARCRELFGVDLPVRTLFEANTVEALARRIAEARGETAGGPLLVPPLVQTPRGGESPLSFAQQRLWFLDQLEPGTPFYNIPLAVRLDGTLDAAALEASLEDLARRHETLRTSFVEREGEPVQRIAAEPGLLLEQADLAPLGEGRHAAARELLEGVARHRFDLTTGPLLRALLVRLDEREHLLALSFHHIVFDGWSIGICLRDLGALYAARVEKGAGGLAPLPVQYADFAIWQRAWLRGEILEAQLAVWRRRLAGVPPLDLSTDRPRPRTQSARGAMLPFAVPAGLRAAAAALGRRQGSTPFMVVLAAFQALLARWSGQEDVAVGIPIANRTRVELEGLIGFFANTLVLRGQTPGEASFATLLAAAREVTLEAYAHQDVPFERLVEELQPERDLSRTPLFQVMLAFQNTPATPADLPGLRMTPLPMDAGTAKFDLTLFLGDGEDGWDASLEYALDLFDEPTVGRFASCFLTLLESAVADPALPVGGLAVITVAERHQVLLAWNDTDAALPLERPFIDLFAEQVALRPDSVAATAGPAESPVTLSYAELDRRAERLARALKARGTGPESLIALLDDRGLDLLTAILAVFKTGAAYLPLDPAHPAPRLRQVLGQSGAGLVLTDAAHRPVLEEALAEMERLPFVAPISPLADDGEDLAPLASLPESLAYAIFTSGSTGLPKGAMVSQRGMVNHLWAKIRDLDLGPGDTVAQTASQCFDISVWQHLAPLAVGGRVRIYADDVAHDPPLLLARAAADGVTVLQTVPSLLREMLEQGESPELPALRWLVPTGEALAPDLWERWLRRYPAIPLVNAYGPTECSDDVTHALLAAPPPEGPVRVPVGRPVVNTRLYVADRRLEITPAGVAGELCVGGAGVGRGYLGDPVRTALVFVPDPFSGDPGARLYRTGDLTRRRSDGVVEFLGRIDHQVKIRGYRIELGEIEAALGKHPEVREAVVLALTDVRGEKRLAAYVVPRDGRDGGDEAAVDLPALRAFLAERLPEYMVPTAWVPLAALPLTANGKVDRKALPAPEISDPAAAHVAPRDDNEEAIAAIWREVLGVERVGIHDNFFEIGGHSLLATRAVARLRAAFAIDLPLRTLFEAPTVAGLAEVVARQRQAEESTAAGAADILQQLESLSEEEAALLLQQLLASQTQKA